MLPAPSMLNGHEGRVDGMPDKGLDPGHQRVHGDAGQVHEDEPLHLVVRAESIGRMDHEPIVGEARGHQVVELNGRQHGRVDVQRGIPQSHVGIVARWELVHVGDACRMVTCNLGTRCGRTVARAWPQARTGKGSLRK